MISIARKNLFQDKGRFLISVGGVAFAVLLILILQALYQGWNEKITVYIDSVDTDLWVMQEGTQDMFHTLSIMPENIEEVIKQTDGAADVNRLLGRAVMNEIRGEKQLMMLIGFNTDTGIGGPARVAEGNATPADGEIIIDRVFAKNNNFQVGDEIEIAGHKEKIVGISVGGDMAMAQVAYVNVSESKKIFGFEEVVNYFLVKVQDDKNIEDVKDNIENNIENIDVLSVEVFGENNKKIILDSFLPILLVLVIIGFIIGVVVIGLTIYTLTIEKTREFGILKAIGLSNYDLYKIVFKQSLISGLIGFILGIIFTLIVSYIAEFYVPEFVTTFRIIDIIWVFGATILMGLIASYIPIKKISKIDPAIVFKS